MIGFRQSKLKTPGSLGPRALYSAFFALLFATQAVQAQTVQSQASDDQTSAAAEEAAKQSHKAVSETEKENVGNPQSEAEPIGVAEAEAQEEESEDELSSMIARMFNLQSAASGAELEEVRREAASSPLGSAANPVRAEGPPGQRAYISRLRCSDGRRPDFGRLGSAGLSPYGNIVDIYQVGCGDAEPTSSQIYIDMYHSGHVEDEAVPGFTIVEAR